MHFKGGISLQLEWKKFDILVDGIDTVGESVGLKTSRVRVFPVSTRMYATEINSWDGFNSGCRFEAASLDEAKQIGIDILKAHLNDLSKAYARLSKEMEVLDREE